MLDFMTIATRSKKPGTVEIYPKFIIKKSEDLMIRGGDFYAVWVEDRGLWSTEEDDLINLIDRELARYTEEHKDSFEARVKTSYMWDAESGVIDSWHKYCQKQLRDSYHILDEKLIFSNNETNKKDYASKRLGYPLEAGDCPAYEKIISTLYTEEERHKLEWAIGSIVSGDSKNLQKFIVLYGGPGTGKSTILNIIEKLFDGYCSVFDAKALGSASAQFALEPFKKNPLVAIQHDGDLSRIEDNTRLNSVVSHETMSVNEKHKSQYENRFICFLFLGTNRPVKITDAKSGILRRLIDVSPSGNKLNAREYKKLVKQVDFELGAIAHHCLQVYLANPGAYDDYTPLSMMGASNDFYNFVIDSYHIFKREDGTTLKAAWEMYKNYIDEAKVSYPFSQRVFKEELKNYFREYDENFIAEDGTKARCYYSGFRTDKFETETKSRPKKEAKINLETKAATDEKKKEQEAHLIKFEAVESIFDKEYADCFAQYASSKETPSNKWDEVKTRLSSINTRKLHYVKVPENHIVIDFDIKGKDGKKSFERNLEEASKWPATYAELSKSGAGIHLHYIYTGDTSKLSRIYDDDIEIKVFTGKSSLRRKLTKCNELPIATISSGLPTKGEDKLISWDGIKNEKMLRTMIKRNLNKEYHSSTKCSIDYINNLLTDAYNSGIGYDVSDLYNAVLSFGANSTNQAAYCMKLVNEMKFKSEEANVVKDSGDGTFEPPIVFYDIEVFPNLFLVNWKFAGDDKPVVRMINPTPTDIEGLLKYRLVGFNNRRYDNHVLYGCLLGYSNEQLYNLSQKIINSEKGSRNNGLFGEAYNLSYTDVYDFAAKKQSLKKWEIELGIHHQELGLPWDKPVPEELWSKVAEYCDNDVIATEKVFNHLQGDFTARKILAGLAGLTVNDTTNSLTTRIIFGNERKPKHVYTDLATGDQYFDSDVPIKGKACNAFPGYEYKYDETDKKYHNMYRGTDVGKGGYVYAKPGIYTNVALIDVQSMHPASLIAMNCFGEYTKNFKDIRDARVAIKHGDFDTARKMLDGKLAPYLDDETTASDLAQALKIAINSVYGLTSAGFDNPMRDSRNKNNIVALRGALFMRTLQDEVEARGFTVVHIKTDSIKIANATQEIIDFCLEFANKYEYIFEHEATYDRICLVNDAVYIARYKDGKHAGEWTATGTQFQVPYVFKKLFSKEPIVFEDMCETKSVTSALYLDMNETLPDVSEYEDVRRIRWTDSSRWTKKEKSLYEQWQHLDDDALCDEIAKGHDYRFIGKVSSFCPIKPGCGGGELLREANAGGLNQYASATGAKGYRWLEAEMVKTLGKEDDIDVSYYTKLVDDAVDAISIYGDFEWFVSDDTSDGQDEASKKQDLPPIKFDGIPWTMACGRDTCEGCPHFNYDETQMSCKLGHDISDLIYMNSDEHCIVYDSCDPETLEQYKNALARDRKCERISFNKQ